jgi:hypothetical protein
MSGTVVGWGGLRFSCRFAMWDDWAALRRWCQSIFIPVPGLSAYVTPAYD